MNPTKQQDASVDAMEKYGIMRVTVDQYHYRHYRYSRLSEAVAQARRDIGESDDPSA